MHYGPICYGNNADDGDSIRQRFSNEYIYIHIYIYYKRSKDNIKALAWMIILKIAVSYLAQCVSLIWNVYRNHLRYLLWSRFNAILPCYHSHKRSLHTLMLLNTGRVGQCYKYSSCWLSWTDLSIPSYLRCQLRCYNWRMGPLATGHLSS